MNKDFIHGINVNDVVFNIDVPKYEKSIELDMPESTDIPEELMDLFYKYFPNGKMKIVDILAPFIQMMMFNDEDNPITFPELFEDSNVYQYEQQPTAIKEGLYAAEGSMGGYILLQRSPFGEFSYGMGLIQQGYEIEEFYMCSGISAMTGGTFVGLVFIMKVQGVWYWMPCNN